MKKLCVCLLLAVLLAAAGCGKPPFTPALPRQTGFRLQAEAYRIEGTLTCAPGGEIRLRFTYPAALETLTAVFTGEAFRFDIAGAADTVKKEELPTFAPVLLLCEPLLQALSAQQAFTKDGGEYTAALPYGGETVFCRFAPDGQIRQIRCEAKNITIDFR